MERNVLIVDGIDLTRRFIRQSLEKNFNDIIIEEACDSKEAHEMLARKTYDAVICDSDVQPSGGISLLNLVRDSGTFNNTSFILIVPNKTSAYATEAAHEGVNACLAKPFTATELIENLTAHTTFFNRHSSPRNPVQGSAIIYSKPHNVTGQLVDVSLGGILIVTGRDVNFSILDELSFDLCPAKDVTFKDIKGLIIRIQAVDAKPEAQHIKYAIKFLEMPSDVETGLLEYLKRTYPYEW